MWLSEDLTSLPPPGWSPGKRQEKQLWVTVVSDRRGLCLVSFAGFPSNKGGGFSSGSAAKNLPVIQEAGFDP